MADDAPGHSATDGAVSACVDAGGSALGMPQLCGDWFANQIFWFVIAIVVIYFILSRVALPRIAGVLAERQGAITNDIAMAEELKLKAQAAEAAYTQALADARAEAQKIIAETRAEIQIELDAATAKADSEIAAKAAESEKAIGEIRASALESIDAVAKDTAAEIIGAFGGTVNSSAVNAAVAAAMKD